LDIYGLGLIGVIGFISGSLSVIAILGWLRKTAFFEEILENFIVDASNDEDLQKSLFTIGGIIGSGIKGGVGLDAKPSRGSGKLNLNNILLEVASQFITQKIANPSPTPVNPTLSLPQTTLRQESRDKW